MLWRLDEWESDQGRGGIYYIENLGNEQFAQPQLIASNFTGLHTGKNFVAKDVTQDGLLDLILLNGPFNNFSPYGLQQGQSDDFYVSTRGFFVLKNLLADGASTKPFEDPLYFEGTLDRADFFVEDLNSDGAPDVIGVAGAIEANYQISTLYDTHSPVAVHLNLNLQDGSVGFAPPQMLWTAEYRDGVRLAGLIDANNDGVLDIITQSSRSSQGDTFVELGTGLATNNVSEIFHLNTPWNTTASERSLLRKYDSGLRRE